MAMDNFEYTPNNGLMDKTVFSTYPATEEEARQQFMTLFNQVKDTINSLINTLSNTTALTSGAEQIGSAPIEDVEGDTIYTQLTNIKLQLNSVVLNDIPDGTVTGAKLADLTIMLDKLAEDVTSYFAKQADVEVLADNQRELYTILYYSNALTQMATELGAEGVLYNTFKTDGLIDAINSNVKYTTATPNGTAYITNLVKGTVNAAVVGGTGCYMSDEEKAYDSDDTTFARAYYNSTTTRTTSPGITYDLGSVATITKFRVKLGKTTPTGDATSGINIMISTDNIGFSTIKTYTSAELEAGVDELINVDYDVRYVKFVYSVSGSFNQNSTVVCIYAFEAYRADTLSQYVSAMKDIGIDAARGEITLIADNNNYKVFASVDNGATYTEATLINKVASTIISGKYEHNYKVEYPDAGAEFKLKVYAATADIYKECNLYGWTMLGWQEVE